MIGQPVQFPFGHGLSYTSFKYAWSKPPTVSNCTRPGAAVCMAVSVMNAGPVSGAEVAQLYVTFPQNDPDEPALKLASFGKTKVLQPNESANVEFTLGPRAVSSWLHGNWTRVTDTITFSVGSSSRDLRFNTTWTPPALR